MKENHNHSINGGVRVRKNAFGGKIVWVHIAAGDDSHDHFIDEEDRIRIAMSLQ